VIRSTVARRMGVTMENGQDPVKPPARRFRTRSRGFPSRISTQTVGPGDEGRPASSASL
jgi:hypothetical protein